jgi:hypothetical protein
MKRIALLFALIGVTSTRADEPRFIQLLGKGETDPAAFAEAVNHYVDLGEDAAVKELKKIGSVKTWDEEGKARAAAFLCRVLYQPKKKEPLRPPSFGVIFEIPPMDDAKWPLYPVIRSGDTHFILGWQYAIFGLPEPTVWYIDYRRANGTFLKEHIPVPTRAQASKDLDTLLRSDAWGSFKWADYRIKERAILKRLSDQVERIPAK